MKISIRLLAVQMLAACAGITMVKGYFFIGLLFCIASTHIAKENTWR